MQAFTVDVLLIGFVVAMVIEAIKAPIKSLLIKKGLKDDEKKAKTFKAIVTAISFIMCFVGACIYFWFFKHTNPFLDDAIIWYTIGTVGASQSIYMVLETYGRDGIMMVIKTIISNKGKQTDIAAIPTTNNTDELSEKIVAGIQSIYEGAPVTKEDVKSILDHIQ